MKRLPVCLREEAVTDLQEIAAYIADKSGSRKTALGFIRRIKARCLGIGEIPNGSPLREDLGPGIRLAAFERSAVIAYQVLPNSVEVVNIFYGGRDYETLMRVDP
jgi:toxin ParE1/3/4